MGYLLDTNIVTAILKDNQVVVEKLSEVRLQGNDVFISCITYLETEAGLLAVKATNKLARFQDLCRTDLRVLLLDTMETVHEAAAICADLRRKGTPIQMADILIAATAISHNLILISDDSDMLRVQRLTVENWLR
ncbi:PIN domain protein [Microcystis aeruginosa TAIHU98]|uniref:Ribonuclease VapC n=1 Tax=Microcystis aeruginosa TAIHU98 TaxID=1134457 RepID=L7EC49_MICAE|nr:type II toxin-antitoxin system VapC family toxin [Microcystis aeruginosa]ELP56569.1 PIN domain protein [Microcystis aeruginosa TAIHU98]